MGRFALNLANTGFSAPARERLAVDVDSVAAPEWDRIIGGFDDMNLFQAAAFADGLRGESHISHLLLRHYGEPVAGARVAIMKPPGFPFGVAYVKHGPFWRKGAAFDLDVYRAAVAAIVEEYGRRRGHLITISPRPHPQFQPFEKTMLEQAGFSTRPLLKRPITYFVVNTGQDEAALRASLSQSWRHNLKQAEKHQLEISFRKPAEALPDFLALHESMIARKQFADRTPLHVLPRMFTQLPSDCCHIVTAAHAGEVVAGAVIVLGGDVAYYLYGASADSALNLRAGYALHWRIALWAAERGIGWYDLGDGFGHLRQFKQGFSGKTGAVVEAAEFDYAPSAQARLIGGAIYGARDVMVSLRSWQSWMRKQTARLRSARDSGN